MRTLNSYELHQEALKLALWEAPMSRLTYEAVAKNLSSGADMVIAPTYQDVGVGNVSCEDGGALPELGPLSEFPTWQSVASTLVHKAETLTGFKPESTEYEPFSWTEYMRKLSSLPFLLSSNMHQRSLPITPLSLEAAVFSVQELCSPFVAADHLSSLITSIKKLAQLAVENTGESKKLNNKLAQLVVENGEGPEKINNQQQGILSVLNGQLYLGVLRTSLQMEYKPGKGYEQVEQQINLNVFFGRLDLDKCKRSAAALRTWEKKSVEDWVNNTASASKPPNNSPAWG